MDRVESPWAPWRQALELVLITRIVFYGVAYAATWLLASTQGPQTEGFLDIWARWDARHFFVVAEEGWVGPEAEQARPAAFFPLYPLLIRGLSTIGFNPVAAGLLVSTVATVVACAFLIRLADEELGEGTGRRAASYLVLFPTAVFLVAPYSEALFLAGAIPAFYYARRQRWTLVALPAAIATASRAAGVFLLFGLFVELVRQMIEGRNALNLAHRVSQALGALAVAVLPIAAYALYLQAARGSWRQFFIDQSEGWGRSFVGPIQSFLATWNTRTGTGYPTNFIFAERIEIVAALAGIALTIWALAKKEWGYAAYVGTFMAALVTSSWYMSIPRMLLSCFPAVLFLAERTGRAPQRHETTLLALAPAATLGVVVFTRGAWFF